MRALWPGWIFLHRDKIPLATLTPQIVTYFADSHLAMRDT
jgi:hypothetical protein